MGAGQQYQYGAVDHNSKKFYDHDLYFKIMLRAGTEAMFVFTNIVNGTEQSDPEQILKNIIWIVSEKTVNWAYGDVGYYPQNKPFSRKYIEKYINSYFKIIYNAENQIFILQLK